MKFLGLFLFVLNLLLEISGKYLQMMYFLSNF